MNHKFNISLIPAHLIDRWISHLFRLSLHKHWQQGVKSLPPTKKKPSSYPELSICLQQLHYFLLMLIHLNPVYVGS